MKFQSPEKYKLRDYDDEKKVPIMNIKKLLGSNYYKAYLNYMKKYIKWNGGDSVYFL